MYAKFRKHKYESPLASGSVFAERWTIVWAVLILVAVVALLYAAYQSRSSPTGPFREEYEGRVIDKWAAYSESEEGSRPYFRLMIESDDHQRFPVSVSREIYDRAKMGMRIRKSDKGVEVWSEAQDSEN